MINRFMISVAAAALIASSGLANAQGTGMSREAPSGGATMQQGAPSSDRGAATATWAASTEPGLSTGNSFSTTFSFGSVFIRSSMSDMARLQ